MDPVFDLIITRLRSRKEVGDLPPTHLATLNECLELLEKVNTGIEAYADDVQHLKPITDLFMRIAENKRNRDLEIVFLALAAHYFEWWYS